MTAAVTANHMNDFESAVWDSVPNLTTEVPGPSAQQWVDRDERVTSTSNTREYPLVVKRALGSVVEDVDSNVFLDFTSGIAVCAAGHCHPDVVAAITAQTNALMHICGSDFYYPAMAELAEALANIAPWKAQEGTRVYFTNSGAETVEAGIKLARHRTQRKRLIAFHGAFHGRTMGALALTASKYKQKLGFGPLIPMVSHVEYGCTGEITDRLFKQHFAPNEVAAIVVEAIQGEGGYNFPHASFLPTLRSICDEHGILLIIDEIQTGVGRTGTWWACEHDQVVPDMILSAKGLAGGMPLGALITKESVMNWPPGAQGSTYGGNPVACASALATIKLIESGYMANAKQQGQLALDILTGMESSHARIKDSRGRGLMVAFDVVGNDGKYDAQLRDNIIQAAFQRGLLLLPCGEHAIRVIPPLCVTAGQIEVGLDILAEAIQSAS